MKPISDHEQTIDRLHYFRGLSSFAVYLSHFCYTFFVPVYQSNDFFYAVGLAARFAVLCFFILSGYFIALSFATKKGFDLVDYLLNRFARIYPPFLFCIFLTWAISFLFHNFGLHGSASFQLYNDIGDLVRPSYPEVQIGEILANLPLAHTFLGIGSYLNINGPLWSLSYEVGFYLIFGLAAAIFFENYFFKILSVVLLVLIYNSVNTIFIFFFLLWILGFLAYYLSNKKYFISAITLLCLVGFALTKENSFVVRDAGYDVFYQGPISLLLGLILFTNISFKLPFSKVVNRISNYSYSLYLCHFPIFLLEFSFLHEMAYDNIYLYWLLTLCCFVLNFYLIEHTAKYFENKQLWKKYFINLFFFYRKKSTVAVILLLLAFSNKAIAKHNTIIKEPNLKKPQAAVIVLTNSAAESFSERYTTAAKYFLSHNKIVLSVDAPCYGENKKTAESESLTCWAKRIENNENLFESFTENLHQNILKLNSKYHISPNKICFIGVSKGFYGIIQYMQKYSDVKCAVGLSPMMQMNKLEEFSRITQNPFFKKTEASLNRDFLKNKIFFITMAKNDERVSTSDFYEILKLGREVTSFSVDSVIVSGTAHAVDKDAENYLFGKVDAYLNSVKP